MLQRCGQCALSRSVRHDAIAANVYIRLRQSRHASSSSGPDPARKLPGSDGASDFRSWRRGLAATATIGLAAWGGWTYYDDARSKSSFVTYRLVAKEPVSSSASIFHLVPAHASSNYEAYQDAWKKGIWSVQFKQPQLQIVRAYTPLPSPSNSSQAGQSQSLRFLIRHDPHGEVSNYLHRLPIGSEIEARGPNVEYSLTPDIRQVVFFAGGTGIAPALQIAHAMFDADGQKTGEGSGIRKDRKLHILWANRRREDCSGGTSDEPAEMLAPSTGLFSGLFSTTKAKKTTTMNEEKGAIVQELEALKKRYPGQITVEYFVNAENTWINEEAVFRSMSRFDDTDFSGGSPSQSEQRQILISGPNGFITYLAGPKEWRHGQEQQGSVSRIVAHAIAQNPHHVKVWKV